MDINNIPDLRKDPLEEKITICVTKEVKKKLEDLKDVKGKNVAEALRYLIDNFLRSVDI